MLQNQFTHGIASPMLIICFVEQKPTLGKMREGYNSGNCLRIILLGQFFIYFLFFLENVKCIGLKKLSAYVRDAKGQTIH